MIWAALGLVAIMTILLLLINKANFNNSNDKEDAAIYADSKLVGMWTCGDGTGIEYRSNGTYRRAVFMGFEELPEGMTFEEAWSFDNVNMNAENLEENHVIQSGAFMINKDTVTMSVLSTDFFGEPIDFVEGDQQYDFAISNNELALVGSASKNGSTIQTCMRLNS